MAEITCEGRTTREINAEIKRLAASGEREIVVKNPGARHNIAVAVLQPARIRIEGSVGYFCAGLSDGPTVEIAGSAGWGLAESMLTGQIMVRGSAGNGAAAAIMTWATCPGCQVWVECTAWITGRWECPAIWAR